MRERIKFKDRSRLQGGPYDWKQGNVHVLVEVKDLLKEKKWFLSGSTLLAAVRQHTLFSQRHCLNIAVIDKDDSIYNMLESIGFESRRIFRKYGMGGFVTRRDAYIDIWIFEEIGDYLYLGCQNPSIRSHPFYNFRVPKQIIEPLSIIKLSGFEFPAPGNFEEYVTLQYGPHWRVPVDHNRYIAFQDCVI